MFRVTLSNEVNNENTRSKANKVHIQPFNKTLKHGGTFNSGWKKNYNHFMYTLQFN